MKTKAKPKITVTQAHEAVVDVVLDDTGTRRLFIAPETGAELDWEPVADRLFARRYVSDDCL